MSNWGERALRQAPFSPNGTEIGSRQGLFVEKVLRSVLAFLRSFEAERVWMSRCSLSAVCSRCRSTPRRFHPVICLMSRRNSHALRALTFADSVPLTELDSVVERACLMSALVSQRHREAAHSQGGSSLFLGVSRYRRKSRGELPVFMSICVRTFLDSVLGNSGEGASFCVAARSPVSGFGGRRVATQAPDSGSVSGRVGSSVVRERRR
jgi:hypothetical protein